MKRSGVGNTNDLIIDLASPKQWNAIKLPLRMAMLEVITASGGTTARALAEVMSRPQSLVHYHLKILCAAGILRSTNSDGGRGRVFETIGRRLVIVHDGSSKVQAQRARSLMSSRLDYSMSLLRSRFGERSLSVMSHLESLTPAEHKEVVRHFEQVDRILARARRRRRRQGLSDQRATSHVVFAVDTIDDVLPPMPRIEVRSRS